MIRSRAMGTVFVVIGMATGLSWSSEPKLRLEFAATRPEIPVLSWDTEGGPRVETNLVCSGSAVGLRVRVDGAWSPGARFPTRTDRGNLPGITYRLSVAPDAELIWNTVSTSGSVAMSFSAQGTNPGRIDGVELVFPFDPRVTPTTVLPADWADDGSCRLPVVINAPDFGQMLLKDSAGRPLKAWLEGSRTEKWVNFRVELPSLRSGERCALSLVPVRLPAVKGLADGALWRQARRGWFGTFEPSARWGDQNRPFSAPAGILANNVISDPASCSLWFYADQAFWTPQLAEGISIATTVRRSIDWWLDHRTRPTGEVVCYWDYGNFLDANAGPLIASWDYVVSTGDVAWLARRIEQLERVAEFLAHRDVNGDGLVEAVQSGNRGTLHQPARSCCWFDALNCGHQDGYTNALIYRGWRCLADLEDRLGHVEKRKRYTVLADRLKAAYARVLFNPQTGWLAWWKSSDAELHDYASPIVNGLAIEYGLVEPTQGRIILDRLWAKINQAGFKRFDLGIPPMLVPVHRSDYLLPDGFGISQREDGTDTFGHYQNGGITAGQVLHFLAAHYVVGRPERADALLQAMLKRQGMGGFQNGVQDAGYKGIDWTDWNGKPTGYEGYLADSFRFLQAVLLREPSFRERLYRPLNPVR